MRVLSLGAGVQSSTLLLMACEGRLPIDAAVFADTGWEPAAVYAQLERLEAAAANAGIPLYRVSAGNLREDAVRGASSAWLPLHVRNLRGKKALLKRQCTANYKVRPIKRALRALGAGPSHPVDVIIGISWDEMYRMRDSDVQYAKHVYPLVDWRMTRAQCREWLAERGYGETPKSSCVGCPFRDNRGWRSLTPSEFADAVAFDHAMRYQRRGKVEAYLHGSLLPLDMADLRSEQERGQLELFSCSPFGCVGDAEGGPRE